jgi:hypothetical protein
MGSLVSAEGGLAPPQAHPRPALLTCAVLASTAMVVAFHWDLSWHRTIGLDTFFSPPHCLLYLGSLLACLSSCHALLKTTFFGTREAQDASVHVWGLRGPLGAFVSAWGGIAMLSAAVFDDWWHGAYGLDIVILSPPHVVIQSGILAVTLGALLICVAAHNRTGGTRRWTGPIVLYCGGLTLSVVLLMAAENILNHLMHSARFYRIVALVVPAILCAVAQASGKRFGATAAAGVYSLFSLGAIGTLPLFEAEPRLGPVLRTINHFVPPSFPLLLVPAAVVLDLARLRVAGRPLWVQAAILGPLFIAAFAAVQWPFANFLHGPRAVNRLFVADAFAYFQDPSSMAVRRIFLTDASLAEFAGGLLAAGAIAVLTARIGLGFGRWLSTVQR